MRKRTEITIERRRTVVLSRRRVTIIDWCAQCGRQETKLTAEGAGVFCGVSTRTIYRAVERGLVHFSENPDGLIWLCLGSLRELKASRWPGESE